jgi:hypothetical protein
MQISDKIRDETALPTTTELQMHIALFLSDISVLLNIKAQ